MLTIVLIFWNPCLCMHQDNFFEASCSENANFLHLLEELKSNKLNLDEGEKSRE